EFFMLDKPRCGDAAQNPHDDRRAHAVRDLPREELDKLVGCPDALLWENLDRPIKLGHSSVMVRASLRLESGPQSVSYKRFRAKNRWKAFLNLFRSSRALRGWRLGHALLSRGIATPRPILVCEPGRVNRSAITQQRQERAAYLATEWIDGSENLHLWAWAIAEQTPQKRMQLATSCARSLGRLIGRMHARQISHGDLKGSNVLVVDAGDGGDKQPIATLLIDLDGVRIHRRLPRKRQVADLSRLATSVAGHPWVGNSLRMLFLRAYAAEFPRGSVCCKSLWRVIAKKSGKQIAEKRQRGDAIL
ncbi:MAG: lipopolysaccharide kinase InaA family protein, partial [Planctomycetota bacterium]|nr:lipopolysaccharide kinase InaA family protein [Planctomycetota bacterium]